MNKTTCQACGRAEELRFGVCFDCANDGELRAARRSAFSHLKMAIVWLGRRNPEYAWFDLTWAWQRLAETGDYAPGGYFDWGQPEWRINGQP